MTAPWTPARLEVLERHIRSTTDLAALRAFLDEVPVRFDAERYTLVVALYNLGLALIGRPAMAYAISERLTREPVPPKRDAPRRQLYRLALSNALYASLQIPDTALGLQAVARVKTLGREQPAILHNVACVLARAGRDDDAAAAIVEAVAAGYDNVHLLVADDDLVRLMGRDDVRAVLARRTSAIDAAIRAQLDVLGPRFMHAGGVPPDVERLWRMLVGRDARLHPDPDRATLRLGSQEVTLLEDPEGVALPGTLKDGVVPVSLVDDLLVLAVPRGDAGVVFVAVDDGGVSRLADQSLGGLLAVLAPSAAERAFVTSLFKEYAPESGPPPTPCLTVDTDDVAVFEARR
jgi:hypothetical protein